MNRCTGNTPSLSDLVAPSGGASVPPSGWRSRNLRLNILQPLPRARNAQDGLAVCIEGDTRLFDVLDALRCIEYCCLAAEGPCPAFRAILCTTKSLPSSL
jgi:hypothetical protein